jgi:hypothetical protein
MIPCQHVCASPINFPEFFDVKAYLEVRCVDGDKESLIGLIVNLQNSTGHLIQVKTTNSTGWVKFTSLYPDDYTLRAYWMGIKVLDENLTVISEEQIVNIHCSVHDLIIHTTNEKGEKLSNTLVTLYWQNGTEIGSGSTNSTGCAVFWKLPSATYNVKTSLEGYREKSVETSLTSEDQIVTMPLQLIPFIETPSGIATVYGVAIAGIAVTVAIILKKGRRVLLRRL